MKRSPLKRKTPLRARPKPRELNPARDAWMATPMRHCAACGETRNLERHHVIYEQHVVAAKGDPWDIANQLVLCRGCHSEAHSKHNLPLAVLPSSAFDFGVQLLGEGATFEYLRRRYAGTDPRLQRLIGV